MNTNRLLILCLLLLALILPENAMADSGALPVLPAVPVSSAWTGTTSRGYPTSFNVASGGVQWNTFKLKTNFVATTCYNVSGTLEITVPGPGSITNGQFSFSTSDFSASGQFPSTTTAAGNYSFTNHPIVISLPFPPYVCTYYFTQSGSWTATAANAPVNLTVRSTGIRDGWVLEAGETSNQGGSMNSVNTTFSLGDHATDRQYRSILNFNTAALPDNAVITKVVLKIKKQGLVGTDPFTTHLKIAVDIRNGVFGFSVDLEAIDFQAAASKAAVGLIANTPQAGNWYVANLNSTAYPLINLTGTTQFRPRD